MGVLAAGAIFLDGAKYSCGCHQRIDNLRISIAARGIDCEAPQFWPSRGAA